ncbi:hypothetical protein [Sphingomonas profundi]|uniref:hypothetical protein n=1 Tax=Alterirhizorhabdus profundi TaxID=2681549 RepID=UPI0012E92C06|nr:hypothetical protein [Sphingomonas profundi]
MSTKATAAAALLVMLGFAACTNKSASTDALDNELVGGIGNDVDPALADALGNQIVVDPARAGGAKAGRETLGQRAAAQGKGRAVLPGSPCDFRYDAAWARRLPAELPVYPGAKVSEAAGSDAPGCRRRIVSFASSAPAATIVDYYRARVTKAGYSYERLVEQGAEVLGGTRGEAAYYVTVKPAPNGGSTVDLVSNAG